VRRLRVNCADRGRAAICSASVAAVLSIKASRLARSGPDRHMLPEFSAVVHTLIAATCQTRKKTAGPLRRTVPPSRHLGTAKDKPPSLRASLAAPRSDER
jgi:hypothetical protein